MRMANLFASALVSFDDPADAALPQTDRRPIDGRPIIAIIEDDRGTAGALRSIFTRKACEVSVAGTLVEGFALIERPVDYVILDLKLPDGDGIEILRRIKSDEKPVRVVVTTSVDTARLAEVQALRPHRILRKPLDLVDLLSAIGMM